VSAHPQAQDWSFERRGVFVDGKVNMDEMAPKAKARLSLKERDDAKWRCLDSGQVTALSPSDI
jgi:hypothetical protein